MSLDAVGLAALPVTAVGWRFGETGIQLWKRAAGEDEEPLVVSPRPCNFEETTDCGYAIDSFEPLSFLLRAALERLTARLDIRPCPEHQRTCDHWHAVWAGC